MIAMSGFEAAERNLTANNRRYDRRGKSAKKQDEQEGQQMLDETWITTARSFHILTRWRSPYRTISSTHLANTGEAISANHAALVLSTNIISKPQGA